MGPAVAVVLVVLGFLLAFVFVGPVGVLAMPVIAAIAIAAGVAIQRSGGSKSTQQALEDDARRNMETRRR